MVIVKIRDESNRYRSVTPTSIPVVAILRYACHEDYVYVVVGGLRGFGLDLADWLILRGARKLLLTSRYGVVNGYQGSRLRAWRSYGVTVTISTDDTTMEAGCESMLRTANTMGPIDAIFNLAVILEDATFQNQTFESFKMVYGPKAETTIHLDKLSRKLCPVLKHFVVFSSVSCGRGNAGQTNGFINSVMESICERRRKLGLPALAVQWGAIGDVGLVTDMQDSSKLKITGTLQRKISSCLEVLNKFLKQDAVIVSSMGVTEKKANGQSSGDILHTIAQAIDSWN